MEIIIVIAIIAVLAAMTIAGLDLIRDKSNRNRTQVLVEGITNALEAYKFDNNEFPDGDGSKTSSKNLYQALYGDYDTDGVTDENEPVYFSLFNPEAKGNKRNVSKDDGYTIIDAWQNPLYYQSPGQMNPSSDFDLWSLGPDGKGGPKGVKKERQDDLDNF